MQNWFAKLPFPLPLRWALRGVDFGFCLLLLIDMRLRDAEIESLTSPRFVWLSNVTVPWRLRWLLSIGLLKALAIHSNLLKLISAVASRHFDFKRIQPLLNAILTDKSDSEIWEQACKAVTKSTPPP